jgi:membrane-associated phospholipid phosphatase
MAGVEPDAGRWPTWLLSSGSELRLPPPPDAAATRAELDELRALAGARDGAVHDRVTYWAAGAPPYRWVERAVRQIQTRGGASRAGRTLALLNVAIYDATVAAWDTKYAYNRRRPADVDPTLATGIPTPRSPSYPDEHAVAAGAAAAVLAYVFPQDAATFAAWEQEAARSRLEAGVAFPSDVAAGLMLGRQVGERAVAWGRADGSSDIWSGNVPRGLGTWSGTNPVEPLAGAWRPWVLTSGNQFRPGPPPALDSLQMARELAEVRNYPRTNLTNLIAAFWEYYGGRAAFELWNDHASKKIFEYRLADNPPRAARVYALMNVAFQDAFIACWDAKFAYWAPRPQMVDPSITTVFVTPNHPGYPSAHSCLSGAAGGILGLLFPREAAYFNGIADEAGEARIMGGIHFRSDVVAGLEIGRQVARAVWARAGVTDPP